jgi:hypothetical protein
MANGALVMAMYMNQFNCITTKKTDLLLHELKVKIISRKGAENAKKF